MGEKRRESENLEKQNPFLVPEGYMEGLTDRIMGQLPEKTTRNNDTPNKISIVTRLRPWIMAAAAVAGIGFFINVFIGLEDNDTALNPDSLWTQSQMPSTAISEARPVDEEYLEYLEARYSDYILEEEMADSE